MKILITGGAGFIGSALVRYLIKNTSHSILNIDKLTYAGNLESLNEVQDNPRHIFRQMDICDQEKLQILFTKFKPDNVIHLAAESHVDRSINQSAIFLKTNIFGTYSMLEATRMYWQSLPENQKKLFRFLHISTDEVYGDLEDDSQKFFTETTAYAPNSPYSATKASADHLVRAWHRTYGLPTIITNCSNNYGPYQYPEKLIPLTILRALTGKPIPIYGNGTQIRDWLYVMDHVEALYTVLNQGEVGNSYNIGGHNEKKNLEVVHFICNVLEKLYPKKPTGLFLYSDLITHTQDRPGHDKRYAISAEKIKNELGWIPKESFESGMYKTIQWYISNKDYFIRSREKQEVYS